MIHDNDSDSKYHCQKYDKMTRAQHWPINSHFTLYLPYGTIMIGKYNGTNAAAF
jgi:hypothetical protein